MGPHALAAPALVQGGYYFATGVLPIVSIRAFEAITGPKRERWLVKTFGGVIAVIGAVLVSAGLRRRVTPEVTALAVGSAVALGFADTLYAGKRRISPVYLLDTIAELALTGFWLSRSRRRGEIARPAR